MADERAKLPELRGRAAIVAISLVVLALVGGGAWGFVQAGPLGGLLGVLVGIAMGALAFTIIRARASAGGLDDRPAPDVRELPPDQAMQVLTALMNAGASEARSGPSLDGGLLGEIARARARAEGGDLDGALAKLRSLAEQHPRTPAIPAEIARLLAPLPDHASAHQAAASQAITLAIRGGMARLAAQLFEELDDAPRRALGLDAQSWAQLAKIFAARDQAGLAEQCRARADEAE